MLIRVLRKSFSYSCKKGNLINTYLRRMLFLLLLSGSSWFVYYSKPFSLKCSVHQLIVSHYQSIYFLVLLCLFFHLQLSKGSFYLTQLTIFHNMVNTSVVTSLGYFCHRTLNILKFDSDYSTE